ncbi:uncharacterized protein LOC114119483 isoform X2 [Aphis gossypii]|uniref:Uncharacterized protein n=2 Tax=Aphis gossypii TaxID=80765 RepID=A0A9P0NDX0_APHGO|nr:uncharacterized protein LOC114119483 isoform X2 [Aphis gossypii]XP_050066929.1 uncharacterized protein LOC114119483 isoform X2 [Aphis gossypii]XP_050066930.1 uncharacterized protein LOC114119483 isoform X2 [Aphis gossypii]XP_050066931.1 uncharacterized protein LOC114119483 isoform X2 [Aphis gossypii]CAH1714879.1 unnamed protein product [Aphis gossypii]
MVDAVYRGNIDELLSVINHLKKYIIAFIIVLLVLLSVFHFSKFSVHVVPLIIVTLVLLPAVYYTTVLVLKFSTNVIASNQTGEVSTMNSNNNQQVLKTPDIPYPNSPTPPPTYEEATRNDHYYQPQSWLPSTSSGYTSNGQSTVPAVFSVEYQYNDTMPNVHSGRPATTKATTTPNQTPDNYTSSHRTTIQNIPSVTITLDSDQHPTEIQ